MPQSKAKPSLDAARALLAKRMTFEEFLAKLPGKDRAGAERRIAALEALPDQTHANLWRRLASMLMTLAPHAAKLVGKQTLQLYVADGKYRMQVFALEDLQDEIFTLYCRDVVDEAIEVGLLTREKSSQGEQYFIEPSKEPLQLTPLDKESRNPAPHYKDMTGWNRKALRITLAKMPSEKQVEAAELICALAALHFPPAPAPAAASPDKDGLAGRR